MSQATVEEVEQVVKPRVTVSRRGERMFWSGLCFAIAAVVIAGFSRTYFLTYYFGGPPLSLLVHAHGLVFTSWIVLLLVQTSLVAANRTKVHRKLGIVGGVLAVLMVVLGTAAAVKMAALGRSPPGAPPPLVFLTIPLFEMITFPTLIAAGLYYRKRTDYHKRLITIATIAISSAAVARLPLSIMRFGPPAFFGLTDALMIPIVVYDFATRGRIHPATLWGGLFIVGSQILRLIVGGTAAWETFAKWLTSFAA
jgi:hypothetical protein